MVHVAILCVFECARLYCYYCCCCCCCTDGEDYRGGEYTVTFGTEVNAQGCARIGIVIDGVFEDLEDFDTNLSPGDVVNVVVGDRDNTVVIIDDLGMTP